MRRSQRAETNLRVMKMWGAVESVVRAWNDPGPAPWVHARAKLEIRRTWPSLATALDVVTEETVLGWPR